MPVRPRLIARSVVTALLAGYAAVCAGLYFVQRSLVFPRPAPAPLSERVAKVVVLSGPHPTVALHLAAPEGAATVVHFHGNGSQLAYEEWLALACKEKGLGYFGVEFPGYGQAPGEPSEAAVLGAAESAVAFLEGAGVPRNRLVLFGQSLGTGPAVFLASKGVGRALVLATPYTSLADIAARAFPFLPVRLLMRDTFPAAGWAQEVRQPALVFHGTRDQVIPYEVGAALARALPRAELVTLEGVDHNDIWDQPGTLERALAFAAEPRSP